MNVLDSFSLKGKVALVVGGTGLYGRQVTSALAEAGASTYVTTRHKDQLQDVKQEFKQDESVDIHALYMDQTKEDTTIKVRDNLLKEHGKIDILVNNAVARVMETGWNSDTAQFSQSMEINATGMYSVTKIIGNVMYEQKSGSIIQMGSMMGMIGPDGWLYDEGLKDSPPDYFFHKGGMVNFTKYVASYYGQSNVRCNCISPGGIESYRTPPEFVERYNTRTMLNRMANDTDIKGIIVFLASDTSAYITGANIPVDGGYTAK
ncbi:NAD(P)-dependent dehydrogenase, short-chain alcohol dehydrogenase family [Virgibacillus subterraneus]|uniref:NAD(P)-dependent dehydrogenase, short-chain alcohol dehydrogenase family n=1 Tax=Virgibacillus subterraneus TaxID=621109 RepID=A0A1H9G745_9BACI|nr:SDR family oxidoreductase [Virgibacillus subterraneus]SEQ45843.1 NAD(P)-dependent dehydrogenase, short-chain alcohol dehydrogenase family [Virgibacillus subterraneus]